MPAKALFLNETQSAVYMFTQPPHVKNFVSNLVPNFVEVVEGTIEDTPYPLYAEEEGVVVNAVMKRRREFLTGRAFAHRALDALNAPRAPLVVNPDRTTRWPNGFVGSITHSEQYCAVAVAKDTKIESIGIDLEAVERVPDELIPHFLSSDEFAVNLQGHGAKQRRRRAAALFSAKEAIYKCIYEAAGVRLAPKDVLVKLRDGSGTGAFLFWLLVSAGPCGIGHPFTGRYTFDGSDVATAVVLPRL